MIGLVLVTEAQRTERVVTALIFLLLAIAVLLAILTIWYWRQTDPRRHGAQPIAGHRRINVAEPYGHEYDEQSQWTPVNDGYRQAPPRDRGWG